jgi:hypothetical protein
MGPKRGPTPRLTDWLTVSRKVTLTLTLTLTKTSIAGQPLGWPRKSKIGHCSDASPKKPANGRWPGTRRQLAYRPASAAGTADAASSPTGLHRSLAQQLQHFIGERSFRHLFSYSATHRKKLVRYLFSCSPTQKALSRIPPSLTQQALFRAPQSLSGVHDSQWILSPTTCYALHKSVFICWCVK